MTHRYITKTILLIFSLFVVIGIFAFRHIENQEQSNEKQIQNGVNVVELFTSQGCSSCPPADALLSKVKNDKNVIALSYHVDYWDYLGWKDPYSEKQFSQYQRKYAQELNSGVYTPQMVVNGNTEFVGSRESTLQRNLKSKSMVKALDVPVVNQIQKTLNFSYSLEASDKFDSAYALLVLDEVTTPVGRGENARKKLKNTNVVIKRLPLNRKSGKESFEIPNNGNYKIALITQNKDLEILAASISNLE